MTAPAASSSAPTVAAAAIGEPVSGRPPQADRRLTGARCPLYADRVGQVGPDQLVLLRLDGGDDVPHRS
ncbi:hypothetical protein, partial [Micromonospora globispora]|uniref:hypothetical protein n=1 Tax=Micromonospora globispora TaxID=1450148 RepID=UPI001A9C48A4